MSLPDRIGGLRVDAMLGEGGMGRVYQCTDAGLGRAVAVKTLQPHLVSDAVMQERFLREARALARVKSAHVVTVHSIGEDPVIGPYVVMERLVGEDLLARLRQGPLNVDDVIAVARGAAAGLKDAHAAGLLHRDIKPANLFLRDGRCSDVVVTDFGLAKDYGRVDPPGSTTVPESQLTSADIVVGTPAYLAPECARGKPATPGSDLYALGATLFHVLTGQPPFRGDAPIDVLTKAVLEPAPRARSLRADVPEGLDALLNALLEKAAERRPASAEDLLSRLDAVMPSATPATSATPAPATSPPSDFAAPPVTGSGQPQTSGSTMVLGTLPIDDATAAQAMMDEPVTGPVAMPAADPPTTPTIAPDAGFAAPPSTGSEGDPLVSSPKAASVRTATYTVMMTDIAGYTERTSRQSRDEAARWLALHDSLLLPVFRAFSGKVIKTIGDAFMVVFSSPTDAVHCGMAIQDRLFLHNASSPASDQIRVRVALSAGEVRLRGILGVGGDIFGEPVNLAARLEGLAEAGEVLITDAVFSTMNQAEVKTASRGTHAFKGISRPVTVYAVVPTGAAGTPPFSQKTLARVSVTTMDAMAGSARALGPAMRGGLEKVQALVGAVRPDVAMKAAVAVIATVVVISLAVTILAESRRDRIVDGQATAVLAEVEAIPPASRSPSDLVDLGLALIALERRRDGLSTLAQARHAGATDDDIVDGVLQAFAFREGADGIELLASWPKNIDGRLREQLGGDWWPRHHALNTLEKRGVATDDDRQKVGLIDVTAGDCSSRKVGVMLLKKSGRGDEALAAVQGLSFQMASNLCMFSDLKPAEDAIRRRSK